MREPVAGPAGDSRVPSCTSLLGRGHRMRAGPRNRRAGRGRSSGGRIRAPNGTCEATSGGGGTAGGEPHAYAATSLAVRRRRSHAAPPLTRSPDDGERHPPVRRPAAAADRVTLASGFAGGGNKPNLDPSEPPRRRRVRTHGHRAPRRTPAARVVTPPAASGKDAAPLGAALAGRTDRPWTGRTRSACPVRRRRGHGARPKGVPG
jgi:hypothetical protein